MAKSDLSRFWLEDGDIVLVKSNVVKLNPPKRSTKINLIKSVIDNLPYTQKDSAGKVKQQLYWDAKLPGFGLIVGLTAKTFIVQWDIKGKPTRITIGKLGAYTPKQARDEAEQLIPEMKRGVDPRERVREQKALHITLRTALEAYKTSRKTLRLLLERVLPPIRATEETVKIDLPEGAGLTEQGEAIIAAVAAGTLAPGQGSALLGGLGALARVKEMDELERRIAALEAGDGKS